MKKATFILITIFLCVGSLYATEPQKVRYGIVGGLNLSKYIGSDLKYQYGPTIGGKVEYNLSGHRHGWFAGGKALLASKGGKEQEFGDISIRAFYLQLPVYIGYKHQLNSRIALFETAGMYAAYGLFGKTHDMGTSFETFSSTSLKRFDTGVDISFGAEFARRYQIAMGIDFGLLNVRKFRKNYNFNVSFTLAYML